MKKLLRLDDVARGGRGRDEVYDLLGLRVIVTPYPGMPAEEAELAATQVHLLSHACDWFFQDFPHVPCQQVLVWMLKH